jgi:hypothetical protein
MGGKKSSTKKKVRISIVIKWVLPPSKINLIQNEAPRKNLRFTG